MALWNAMCTIASHLWISDHGMPRACGAQPLNSSPARMSALWMH